jgi:hypothetical protein
MFCNQCECIILKNESPVKCSRNGERVFCGERCHDEYFYENHNRNHSVNPLVCPYPETYIPISFDLEFGMESTLPQIVSNVSNIGTNSSSFDTSCDGKNITPNYPTPNYPKSEEDILNNFFKKVNTKENERGILVMTNIGNQGVDLKDNTNNLFLSPMWTGLDPNQSIMWNDSLPSQSTMIDKSEIQKLMNKHFKDYKSESIMNEVNNSVKFDKKELIDEKSNFKKLGNDGLPTIGDVYNEGDIIVGKCKPTGESINECNEMEKVD